MPFIIKPGYNLFSIAFKWDYFVYNQMLFSYCFSTDYSINPNTCNVLGSKGIDTLGRRQKSLPHIKSCNLTSAALSINLVFKLFYF